MPISCVCGASDYNWCYVMPTDYSHMPHLPRRKRCCSCSEFIEHNSLCVELVRYKEDDDGKETLFASWWLCEACADIFLNLVEYGYCVEFPTDLRQDLKTHQGIQ